LVRNFSESKFEEALQAIEELFGLGSPRAFGGLARQRLLADKIDVTAWMTDYFERCFGRRA
jgi:hypothetical protein